MNELEAAHKVKDGLLPSPTKFGGMTLWNMRVTGTGLSYRSAHKEYVWRDPSIYLNDKFLARAGAGLPLIWEHPDKIPALDSKEFGNRSIGTVMLPYIQGEDVWAVCRVYDDEANRLMGEGQLSTSPAVVFRPTDGNETVQTDEDDPLLIEGTPSYLDHLAVVDLGVWDKNGPPTGIQNDTLTGAAAMADDDKEKAAADAAKHDEAIRRMDAMEGKFDAFMDAFKAMDKERKDKARHDAARRDKFGRRKDGESYKDWKGRHDADEKAMCDALRKDSDESEEDCMDAAKRDRKDAEEEEKRADKEFEKWAKEEEEEPEHKEDKAKKDAEEKAKKDAEEKEEEEEKKDAARKDSAAVKENAELKLRMAALERTIKGITTEVPRADIDALATAQTRADGVAAMFGERAAPPLSGETPLDYRKRLLARFKKHSPTFKETRFDALDAHTLELIEDRVYADSVASARAPGDVTPGLLIPFEERDRAGRIITRFHGDVGAFMEPFVPSTMQLVKMNRNPKGAN